VIEIFSFFRLPVCAPHSGCRATRISDHAARRCVPQSRAFLRALLSARRNEVSFLGSCFRQVCFSYFRFSVYQCFAQIADCPARPAFAGVGRQIVYEGGRGRDVSRAGRTRGSKSAVNRNRSNPPHQCGSVKIGSCSVTALTRPVRRWRPAGNIKEPFELPQLYAVVSTALLSVLGTTSAAVLPILACPCGASRMASSFA